MLLLRNHNMWLEHEVHHKGKAGEEKNSRYDFVEPTLSLGLTLLLNVLHSFIDVHCIGKVLSPLITTIGPELQGNTSSISAVRSSFFCACAIMQGHQDPLVQAEATGFLQQLHLFAARHVNLSSLLPTLFVGIKGIRKSRTVLFTVFVFYITENSLK